MPWLINKKRTGKEKEEEISYEVLDTRNCGSSEEETPLSMLCATDESSA